MKLQQLQEHKRLHINRRNWKYCNHIFVLIVLIIAFSMGFHPNAHAIVNNEAIVLFAKEYIGRPYVWGTHGGATGSETFDCSGFVYFVYHHFGIELSTSSQYYYYNIPSYGVQVSAENALPGDIVSWDGHVGIYTGPNEMINAMSGRGVCLHSISNFSFDAINPAPPPKYVRVNGTFPDNEKPVISDIRISNVSPAGFNVTCKVTDNVGIYRVSFPSWSEPNGMDDVVWFDGTISGDTATVWIDVRNHNNEIGCNYFTNIYAYDYSGNYTIQQVIATVPNTADTEAPIISDVVISNISAAGYTVTCTVTDNVKVTRVAFPSWTEQNGQDDILWFDGTVTGNTAKVWIDVRNHNNEVGCEYLTDIYAYDGSGNYSTENLRISVPDIIHDKEAPVISDIVVSNVSPAGYNVTCKVADDIGVTRVAFPSWTEQNGQDDLVWFDGTISGDTAVVWIDVRNHKNEVGCNYITHIYAYDEAGNYSVEQLGIPVPVNSTGDSTAPVISDVEVTNVSPAGYNVVCKVTDNTGLKRVAFPSWTEQNGQDDLVWFDGTISGDTVVVWIDVRNHNNEVGCNYFTHIYAYDNTGNFSKKDLCITVPATYDYESPVISEITVSNASSEGYNIICTVTDNVRVAKVTILSWTEKDGQDDIERLNASISGNTAAAWIDVQNHNNEAGCYYNTQIIAYDSAGNMAESAITSVFVESPYGTPDFKLPASLIIVEEEAFSGCSFRYVKLSENTTTIKGYAFSSCNNLKHIYIPEATTTIATNAFEGSYPNMIIHGRAGSYAETYAAEKGFRFVAE